MRKIGWHVRHKGSGCDDCVISIQQGSAQKTRANEQETIIFPRVITNQRHRPHGHGQKRGYGLHHRVQSGTAMPGRAPQEGIAKRQRYPDKQVDGDPMTTFVSLRSDKPQPSLRNHTICQSR